jgi:hypothetical protein
LTAQACGASIAEWDPTHPDQQEYAQVVDRASRVKQPSDACPGGGDPVKLGVVRARGDQGETIEAIAKEAAQHGGTHYVVQGDDKHAGFEGTYHYGGFEAHDLRATWAVVYRCGD